MYHLVNAIQDYPEFLPHCADSKIISANDDEIKASLTLEWSGIQKTFTTCNRLQKNKMIEVRLEEGPFKHLEGFWRFEALNDNACKVIFDLEFEIAGRMLSIVFGPIFQQVMTKLVDAFIARANDVYGHQDED
jgi:ribosome-associated toxin RatA of RatAB toxin-antitoxin module